MDELIVNNSLRKNYLKLQQQNCTNNLNLVLIKF